MKIQSRGVEITDVPGVERITVEQDSIEIQMQQASDWYPISQVAQIRNALDAALAEHAKFDTAMTTPNTELVPAFTVGQVLTGTEDLPVGTVVVDGDLNGGDRWTVRENGLLSLTQPEGTTRLRAIVRELAPVTIVSLP